MTEIGPKRFRLIFRGKVDAGTGANQARARFARRFKVTGDKLEQCFSGRKVALRSNLSEHEAFRLQAALQTDGLITRIETMPGQPVAAEAGPATVQQRKAEDAPAGELRMEPAPRTTPKPVPANGSPPPQPAEPAVSSDGTCGLCSHPINRHALHCPYCGARQQSRGQAWPWVAGLALVVLLLAPLLAFLVMPTIQQERANRQVAAAIAQGESTAERLRAFMERTGFRPNSNLDAGLPEPQALAEPPLASIRVSSGALITLTFAADTGALSGKTIIFKPESNGRDTPAWHCRPGTLEARRLPPRCRDKPETSPSPAGPQQAGAKAAKDDGVSQRVIRQAIAESGAARHAMEAFHARQGRWPERNEQAGLQPPRQMGNYAIRAVRVQPGGALRLSFVSTIAPAPNNSLTLYFRDGVWWCRSAMPVTALPENCRRDPRGSRAAAP